MIRVPHLPRQRTNSWRSQIELADELEMGTAISLAPSPDSEDLILDSELAWRFLPFQARTYCWPPLGTSWMPRVPLIN